MLFLAILLALWESPQQLKHDPVLVLGILTRSWVLPTLALSPMGLWGSVIIIIQYGAPYSSQDIGMRWACHQTTLMHLRVHVSLGRNESDACPSARQGSILSTASSTRNLPQRMSTGQTSDLTCRVRFALGRSRREWIMPSTGLDDVGSGSVVATFHASTALERVRRSSCFL